MNEEQKKQIVNKLHDAEPKVLKFFNRMQRDTMIVQPHDEYYVCSRGTGKSEGLDARFILRNVWDMPGSFGALISPTYAKAWGNTLPAICHALAQWGYYEGIHYYVGRKAPKTANFKMPKRPPLRDAWSNCFHFWNGTIMVILSFSNGMSANSMSLDWVIGPEAKFLDYDKIKTEVNPANRGNNQYFDYSAWHHSVMYTTDMPTSKKGKWILDKEQEMIPGHIELIRYVYNQIKDLESLPIQTDYVKGKIKKLRQELSFARKYQPAKVPTDLKEKEYVLYYAEYDIFDNLEVVGEDFVWQMKRDLPPLIFRTAILNERLFKVQNGFYSALEESVHYYTAQDNNSLSLEGYDYKAIKKNNCVTDTDLDFNSALHIAFDCNAAISTLCVGQKEDNNMKTIKSFFVKTPRKLEALVQDFCDYYYPKIKKEVTFYYDHTFVWTTANNAESYHETIIRVLETNNWNVTHIYVGQAPRHDWKHNQIDMALKGLQTLLFPLFNEHNNEYLLIALNRTGIRVGRNGFEKDKSEEKQNDTPDNPDEIKTHITDAWDTLFLGMNFYYAESNSHLTEVSFM